MSCRLYYYSPWWLLIIEAMRDRIIEYRREDIMTTAFSVPDPIEIAYRSALSTLIRQWIPVQLKDITSDHWLKEFASTSSRRSVIKASTDLAVKMVTRINVVNIKSWKQASLKSQRSSYISYLLNKELSGRTGVRVREIVSQNAKYISEIPFDVATQLLQEIAVAQQSGIRASAISEIIKFRFPTIMGNKIKMLARTQTSSANTALSRARSEELGIPCFVWDTSHDQRVRKSHQNMSGVVVFWKNLPSPEMLIGQKDSLGHYAAGDCPYCRCFTSPVLSLEDIFNGKKNLIKVYHEDAIRFFTMGQFTKLSGIESRIAA